MSIFRGSAWPIGDGCRRYGFMTLGGLVVFFLSLPSVLQGVPFASAAGGCLPLFIADDSIWRAPDASPNHWDFVADSP